MNQLFTWSGQGIGVSALASFLPKKSQGWSLESTGWISLQSKGLLRVFSNTTVQSINSLVLGFLQPSNLMPLHVALGKLWTQSTFLNRSKPAAAYHRVGILAPILQHSPPLSIQQPKYFFSFQLKYSWFTMLCSVQFSSITQSCPTICDPMNCTTPSLPVHHHLPESTQTHIHQVGCAIQPSRPLSSPFPPAPNPSHHQSLFQWVSSSHEVAKLLEFQL